MAIEVLNKSFEISCLPSRSMDEFRHKHEEELENVRSKLTSVQSEKKTLALKIADMQAEKSQMEGEIKALNKAQKWVYVGTHYSAKVSICIKGYSIGGRCTIWMTWPLQSDFLHFVAIKWWSPSTSLCSLNLTMSVALCRILWESYHIITVPCRKLTVQSCLCSYVDHVLLAFCSYSA